MSRRYEKQGTESLIVQTLCEVRDLWHPHLADVTIDVLTVVEYDEETGAELPCLKLHGYPAAATIKVMSHERRAQGAADTLLTIDGMAWHELAPRERAALLDHELTHLVMVEKDGAIQRDDLRRPKLKIRLHDIEIGGFREVMARHREHALETMAVRKCRGDDGQYFWDFDLAILDDILKAAKGPSVRIESGGQSVTLTPSHREAMRVASAKITATEKQIDNAMRDARVVAGAPAHGDARP